MRECYIIASEQYIVRNRLTLPKNVYRITHRWPAHELYRPLEKHIHTTIGNKQGQAQRDLNNPRNCSAQAVQKYLCKQSQVFLVLKTAVLVKIFTTKCHTNLLSISFCCHQCLARDFCSFAFSAPVPFSRMQHFWCIEVYLYEVGTRIESEKPNTIKVR